jgi:hypothetical protein
MDYQAFLRKAEVYHDLVGRRDTLSYFDVFRLRNSWDAKTWNIDEVNLLFDKYLIQWGDMARVYPIQARDEIRDKLLLEISDVIRKYSDLATLELTTQSLTKSKT